MYSLCLEEANIQKRQQWPGRHNELVKINAIVHLNNSHITNELLTKNIPVGQKGSSLIWRLLSARLNLGPSSILLLHRRCSRLRLRMGQIYSQKLERSGASWDLQDLSVSKHDVSMESQDNTRHLDLTTRPSPTIGGSRVFFKRTSSPAWYQNFHPIIVATHSSSFLFSHFSICVHPLWQWLLSA